MLRVACNAVLSRKEFSGRDIRPVSAVSAARAIEKNNPSAIQAGFLLQGGPRGAWGKVGMTECGFCDTP
jgi:hypothetical protein